MPIMKHKDRMIAMHDEGYPVNFDDWYEEAARKLAAKAGEYTEEHCKAEIHARLLQSYNFPLS
jgi:sulfur relay (sulfurtransferase) DsrC/TusE family protein